MSEIAVTLAKTALEMGAIKLQPKDPFTWASGYRMPIYNDNRKLLSEARSRAIVAQGFAELILELKLNPEIIAGTATAGIPHATTLADLLKLPLSYVRSQAKDHGMQNRLEGADVAGRRVVVIEDLVSTGGSSADALVAVRDAGGIVNHCLSIFSYGFSKASDCFTEKSAKYVSLLTFPALLQIAKDANYLSAEDVALLASWQEDPFGWGEKNGFPKKG